MFSRTSSGIRNKPLFYRDEYFVYVEGKDDIAFWKIFFSNKVDIYKSKIIPLGGKEELKNYIDQIIDHNAKFIVAMDSDYRLLLGEELYKHPRIIETQCHSIENLMLPSASIFLMICNLAKIDGYDTTVINKWLIDFDSITYPLVIADILIEKNNLGKKCTEENCSRFLKKNSHEFDKSKIDSYIQSIGLPNEAIKDLDNKLKNFLPRYHIRGHFYLNAITCFVCQEVKKLTGRGKMPSISDESFFALALTSYEATLSECNLSQYLLGQVDLAIEDVLMLIKNK
jgi:hypothetical protein